MTRGMTREEREAELDRAVEEIVAKAPPLTPAQRDWLALLFVPIRYDAKGRRLTPKPAVATGSDQPCRHVS